MSRAPQGNAMTRLNPLKHAAALLLAAQLTVSAPAAETGQVARVDGLDVYYGVMPAEILRGHPADHVERKMHRGPPRRSGQQHLIVSLFDAGTRQRVESAQVSARVSEPGLVPQQKILEPMQIAETVTYGNFFSMPGPGPYRIEVEVRRHGDSRPMQAVFVYRYPGR
jgi:hypothetical protein